MARYYTRSFAKTIGKRLKVVDLTPGHISDWITEQKTWGDTTRHEAIGHVQRAFSWAMKRRLIQYHPLLVVDEKPPRRRREVVYTPAQWQAILSHVRDQQFRDRLTFLWETGCRPIEARSIEAVHCDLEHSLVTLPLAKSKGGRRRRVARQYQHLAANLGYLHEALPTAGGYVILEPESWVGQQLPIAQYIDLDLSNGEWIVLLHRHDCSECQAAVPQYERLAASLPLGSPRVALVEIPPFGGEVVTEPICARVKLGGDRDWFVQTPMEIRLRDGIVTQASTELPALGPTVGGGGTGGNL